TYDGHEYATGKFSNNDSTIVISELFREGKRFEVELIVVQLKDIESVKKSDCGSRAQPSSWSS
ncbi:MAG: hypothetical protein PVF33_14165, partial [Candidatus Latescibacterota bacterium]